MREISLHIMDIVQNSITAQAGNIAVRICEDSNKDLLRVEIEDDGRGMDSEYLARVTSPFVTARSTRKVGLGIPLFKAGCERAEGSFGIQSAPGVGTKVCGTYKLSHLDRPPMGDLAGTLYTIAVCNPSLNFVFEASSPVKTFFCSTAEIKEKLGGMSLATPEVSTWLIEYLKEGIDEIFGGNFE
jgi:hypothetical protein